MTRFSRRIAALLGAFAFAALPATEARAALSGAQLRAKILSAFGGVKSYRLTVLGSVRSTGVFVAPDSYLVTTTLDGQPVKTVIVGTTYWVFNEGKWEKSGSTGSSLEADIAGLLKNARRNPSQPFVPLPDAERNGKRVGVFRYDLNGSPETCDYDPKTFVVSRCHNDQLTILYSGFNDPANKIPHVS